MFQEKYYKIIEQLVILIFVNKCNTELKLILIKYIIIYRNMQKYKTVSTLGDGAFGTVYKAKNIKTGEIVAIKKMKQKYTNWNECIELREIKSLRKLNHENIIKLKEVLLVAQELYMVFEYLDYNLYEVYSKMKESGKKFTEKQIKSYIFQITQGLAHMHKNGFFHRDMKPQNLLMYNNIAKVCDLGLARQIRSRPPFTDYVSTRWYRSPELLLRSTSYNSPVDIFALGCIMAELYNLCPLFPGTNQIDQLNKIVKVLGTPEKAQWPQGYKLAQSKGYFFPEEKGISLVQLIPDASMEAIDLIQSMLKYNSRKRPTAQEILKHEYFKGVTLPQTTKQQGKDIVFDQKPEGNKLDTSKQDKNIDIFRQTKRKFKETRNNDAMQSSALFWGNKSGMGVSKNSSLFHKSKYQDNIQNIQKSHKPNDMEDLDSLIKELEDKGNKKKVYNEVSKLPLISTKQKFHPKKIDNLRDSKTQIRHGQPYYGTEKKQLQNYTDRAKQDSSYKNKKKEINHKPPSKSQIIPNNKFSYSFNPTLNPAFTGIKSNSIKTLNFNNNNNLGYPKLSSIKSELKPLNMYRY